MYENVKRALCMLLHGTESISLSQKRDYAKHIPLPPFEEAAVRWQRIGTRMHQSMNKVVGEVAKAQ